MWTFVPLVGGRVRYPMDLLELSPGTGHIGVDNGPGAARPALPQAARSAAAVEARDARGVHTHQAPPRHRVHLLRLPRRLREALAARVRRVRDALPAAKAGAGRKAQEESCESEVARGLFRAHRGVARHREGGETC